MKWQFFIFLQIQIMGKNPRQMTKALILKKRLLFKKIFAGFLILENGKQYGKIYKDFFSILAKEGYSLLS